MAVGVGAGADDNELKSIAMGNADNTMKIGSFDQLAGRVKTLTKELCQGMDTSCLKGLVQENNRCSKTLSTETPNNNNHNNHNHNNNNNHDNDNNNNKSNKHAHKNKKTNKQKSTTTITTTMTKTKTKATNTRTNKLTKINNHKNKTHLVQSG